MADEKTKIEGAIAQIRRGAEAMKMPNNPDLDAAEQNEGRMVAVANLVKLLCDVIEPVVGASGAMHKKAFEDIAALGKRVDEVVALVHGAMGEPAAPQAGAGEELDNTKTTPLQAVTDAPKPPPKVAAKPKAAPKASPPSLALTPAPAMPAEVAAANEAAAPKNSASS